MEGMTVQLEKVLDEYVKELDDETQVIMYSVAKEAKEKLIANSPKSAGGGEYSRGWAIYNNFRSKTYTIYNRTKASLTWLLENGHLIRNQYGTWERKNGGGPVPGKPHIKPVEQWANAEVVRRIMERLNNG